MTRINSFIARTRDINGEVTEVETHRPVNIEIPGGATLSIHIPIDRPNVLSFHTPTGETIRIIPKASNAFEIEFEK